MLTLTTLIAIAVTTPSMATDDMVCPVMGSKIADLSTAAYHDYNGARYFFCCGGCDTNFAKSPAKYLETQAKAKKVAGDFMFDPVTGMRLKSPAIIAETSDYKGVRFHFSSKANKDMFDKEPAKYGTMPKKEALYCAVAGEEIENYSSAASYVDYKEVRYYTCCTGCVGKLKADPAKYVGNAKDHIKTPGIATEPKG
ncbi:MAG: YHS domain-containing protein [Fimbriimonadaceae bacterium]|nr:MAG: YHS domain-containing protein [Fimbriimonadaceae bacterium]